MLNSKKLFTKILEWISEPVSVSQYPLQKSCSGNTGTGFEIPCSKAGYYPLGIVGIQIAGSASGSADVRQYRLQNQSSGSGTAFVYVWNNNSASQTWTITAHVLWVKEG